MFWFDGINKLLGINLFRQARRFWLAKMLTYSGDWSDWCIFVIFFPVVFFSMSSKVIMVVFIGHKYVLSSF